MLFYNSLEFKPWFCLLDIVPYLTFNISTYSLCKKTYIYFSTMSIWYNFTQIENSPYYVNACIMIYDTFKNFLKFCKLLLNSLGIDVFI